jgi:hypothetical protein
MRVLGLVGENGTTTCEIFQNHLRTPSADGSDIWMLQIESTLALPGDYAIKLSPTRRAGSMEAAAYLDHWVNGVQIERHVAQSGSLSVASAAQTLVDAQQGKHLVMQASIDFAKHNVTSLGCTGSVTAGSVATETCDCEGENGAFICEKTNIEGPSCCFDLSAEVLSFDFVIEAPVCGAICITGQPEYESMCNSI